MAAAKATTTGTAGPFVWEVVGGIWTIDAAFCPAASGAPIRIKAKVKAYRASGTFPTDKNATGIKWVKADSNTIFAGTVTNYTKSNSDKNAELNLNFCVSATSTTLDIATFFPNGNAMCAALVKP